jgi:hypothetical protein
VYAGDQKKSFHTNFSRIRRCGNSFSNKLDEVWKLQKKNFLEVFSKNMTLFRGRLLVSQIDSYANVNMTVRSLRLDHSGNRSKDIFLDNRGSKVGLSEKNGFCSPYYGRTLCSVGLKFFIE